MSAFQVKDSGERIQFASGMVRDASAGKIDWWRVYVGPILERLAVHVTKGAMKYPDIKPGVPNWTLAADAEELQRYRESAARHFAQWMRGDADEDHAAAVVFNLNGAEYVKERMSAPHQPTQEELAEVFSEPRRLEAPEERCGGVQHIERGGKLGLRTEPPADAEDMQRWDRP